MGLVPAGWMFVADFGVRQVCTDPKAIAANISLGQDVLASGKTLEEYIQAQSKMIGSHLQRAKIAGPQPIEFPGADAAYLLFVRHRPSEAGDMLHAQTYVHAGSWIGIVTLTTLETQLKSVRPDYDSFIKGLRILPEPKKQG